MNIAAIVNPVSLARISTDDRSTADRGANRQACSAFHQFDDTPVFALALVQRALILAMILALAAALIFGRAV